MRRKRLIQCHKINRKGKVINISPGISKYGLSFVIRKAHQIIRPMITKLSLLQTFARQKEEIEQKELTRKQWINADRIVMLILFLSVIIGAIVFS